MIFAPILVGFLLFVAWDNVAQEWDPYRLTESQRQWFKSVKPKGPGPYCCDISDGHPTVSDRREDGYYVPRIDNPTEWVRVPDEAYTTEGNNPVGVATVWWTKATPPTIRCFVPEPEI